MMGINVNRTISFTFLIAGAARRRRRPSLRALRHERAVRPGLPARADRVHRRRARRDRQPARRRARRDPDRADPAFNEGLDWHTPGSDWTQSIVFAILILILVFRPEGLLGERTPEGGMSVQPDAPARRRDLGRRCAQHACARAGRRLPARGSARRRSRSRSLLAVRDARSSSLDHCARLRRRCTVGRASTGCGALPDRSRWRPMRRRARGCSRSSLLVSTRRGRSRRRACDRASRVVARSRRRTTRQRVLARSSRSRSPRSSTRSTSGEPVHDPRLRRLAGRRDGRLHARLHHDGRRPEHRRRLRGPARPRLRRLLRDGRVHRRVVRVAPVPDATRSTSAPSAIDAESARHPHLDLAAAARSRRSSPRSSAS